MAAPVDRAAEAEDDDEEEVGENGFDTVRCATCEMSEVIEGSAEVREHSLARCVGDWGGGGGNKTLQSVLKGIAQNKFAG